MKTTFDLPNALMRRAKALAARQGRPLRELVAEAIDEKLSGQPGEITDVPLANAERQQAWERWKARLVQLPDGTWFNPEGIEDEDFYRTLDEIRREAWPERNPYEG